ncbi:kinase-like domain-containing protein [Sparassis latifolia]
MVAVTEPAAPAPSPPAVGTCIDNGTLELVEILGYGGYGVVYRAVDIFSPDISYAVKCLPHSRKRNAERQRQLHLREIMLHQLSSAHPNVVTLHRVIEDFNYTYLVMDYCPDGDLFTQILHNRRYLGSNKLIKEVFLQLLDAVEYCHSLNIYHRDLKPENVLCFDGGKRLAITDFGLATTEKMSTEFRTGSVYHMSPECQGGYFAPTKSYSPLFNDIWSLGIILLNLITGRNPWKSASVEDCTFQAYLQDPMHFLPTVLPISEEVNLLLSRTLEVDWRRRITLREMRLSIMVIDNFYSPDVLFEDSMARCPWEAGIQVDTDSESSEEEEEPEPEPEPKELPEAQDEGIASTWSNDSESDMVFATQSVTDKSSWAYSESYAKRDSYARSMSPSPDSPLFTTTKLFEMMNTPSAVSAYSILSSSPSIPSLPVTPEGGESLQPADSRRPKALTLNTADCHPSYYDSSVMMLSARSSTMHTALDSASQFDSYGYCSIFAETMPTKASLLLDSTQDIGMITTPITAEEHMDTKSMCSYPTIDADQSMDSARPESPILGLSTGVNTAVKPEADWEQAPLSAYSFLTFSSTPATSPRTEQPWPAFSFLSSLVPHSEHTPKGSFRTDTPPLPSRPPLSPHAHDRKSRASTFMRPIKLAFTRRASSHDTHSTKGRLSRTMQTESVPTLVGPNWVFTASTSRSPSPQPHRCLPSSEDAPRKKFADSEGLRRRRRRLRSPRAWFSSGKLFASVLQS